MKLARVMVAALFGLASMAGPAAAQSRANARPTSEFDGSVITVTTDQPAVAKGALKVENLFLYENGIEQKIRNFAFDPSPSRIVLLVDNSQTLRADVESMKKAAMEFAYEIFEGDQLFIVAYDEKPEIIQEWTDDAKKLEASLGTLRKRGNPYLFDAISLTARQVLLPLMPATRKTAIVLIADGLDRGSKVEFDSALAELQNDNIVVYTLEIPDRSNGSFRRNTPKAGQVLKQLAEGTGGRQFAFDDPQAAAKAICDELRNNRYLLSYLPTNTSSFDARRVFLTDEKGTQIRTKSAQPPNIK